jgi:transposase-like protein
MLEMERDGRAAPDPELVERPLRRRFSAEYKLRILREVEACTRPGEIGALLRREGLYSGHLSKWRRQRDAGALEALGRPRGRKPVDRRELEIAELHSRQLTSSSPHEKPHNAPSSASTSSAHATARAQKTSSPQSPTRNRR